MRVDMPRLRHASDTLRSGTVAKRTASCLKSSVYSRFFFAIPDTSYHELTTLVKASVSIRPQQFFDTLIGFLTGERVSECFICDTVRLIGETQQESGDEEQVYTRNLGDQMTDSSGIFLSIH